MTKPDIFSTKDLFNNLQYTCLWFLTLYDPLFYKNSILVPIFYAYEFIFLYILQVYIC